ncbi:MAG: 50S ribosomal protein L13 [bacterium]|nr:50S ribosomal protein L13 [bacterium]
MNNTYMAKKDEIKPEWFIVDAEDMVLGRLASFVASRIRGKHKPEFTPNQLCGDTIIVINAEKVRLTGNKAETKAYHNHTGYQLKTRSFKQVLSTYPSRIIEKAVKGMLPKNVLGRRMFGRLKVYAGTEHPHTAQAPTKLDIS